MTARREVRFTETNGIRCWRCCPRPRPKTGQCPCPCHGPTRLSAGFFVGWPHKLAPVAMPTPNKPTLVRIVGRGTYRIAIVENED